MVTEAARSPRLTVGIACVAFFVTVLDSTAVTVALPTIGDRLGGDVSGLQWVVDAYALMFAALLLSAGAISDRAGASRAFGFGLAVFTLASAACGLAPSLPVLIAARVVQGGAAALMLPASLSLVRQAFDDSAARARAIAWWAAGGGAAIAAGPVAGGVLTGAVSWRAIFFVNLPAGVIGLLGLLKVPRSVRRPAPVDTAGQVTSVVAMAAVTFAMIESRSGVVALVALVVFVVAAAAFVLAESRSAHPAVPLGLFRSVPVAVCTATGFALNFAFYGTVFVLTLFLQEVRHASAVTAGLMFLPMTGLVTITNLVAGALTNRYGPRLPMVAGQLLLAGGLLSLIAAGPASPVYVVLGLLIAPGLGGGLVVPPMTAALLEAVDAERSGLASGLLNAARQLGGAIGVAAFGALVSVQARFMTGMRVSLAIGATALLIAATTGLFLLERSSPEA